MNKDKPVSIKPNVYADTNSFKEESDSGGAKKKLSDFNSEWCVHCSYSKCPFVCIEDCVAYQSHYWFPELDIDIDADNNSPKIALYTDLLMGQPTLDPYTNRFND